jgi:outer membrane protein TolC
MTAYRGVPAPALCLLLAACGGLPPPPPREAPPREREPEPDVPAPALEGDLMSDVVTPIDGARVSLDLEACLRLAGAGAPELERARARFAVVRAQAAAAGLRLWPSLEPQALVQREQGRIVSATGDVPSRRWFWSATLGVALRYVLNPLEAIHDRNASLLAAEALAADTQAQRQAAMRRAGALYAELQAAHALATLAHAALAAATARADLLRQQAHSGLVPAADAADADLAAARRARELHDAAADARQRSVDLALTVRLDPRVTISPAPQFRAFALVDPRASLDVLLGRAQQARPERVAADAVAASKAAAETAARWRAFGPSLALSLFAGGAGRIAASPAVSGPDGLGGRTSIGLGLFETLSPESWGHIGVAASSAAGAELDAELVGEAIAASVVAARTSALDAFARCELAQQELRAATAARQAAEQRRDAGLATGLDVWLRREHESDGRRRVALAVASWNRAQLDLLFALGGLAPAME